MKILIIEDDLLQRKIAMAMFGRFVSSEQIDTAETCQIAREKVNDTSYDLIIMDFGLPDGDGLALTKEFRQKGIKSTIYGLSGNFHDVPPESRAAAGLDGGYQKPLSKDKAKACIDAANEKPMAT